jgi:hypothetical protein
MRHLAQNNYTCEQGKCGVAVFEESDLVSYLALRVMFPASPYFVHINEDLHTTRAESKKLSVRLT